MASDRADQRSQTQFSDQFSPLSCKAVRNDVVHPENEKIGVEMKS